MRALISRGEAIETVEQVCDELVFQCDKYFDEEVGDDVYCDEKVVDAIDNCCNEVQKALSKLPAENSTHEEEIDEILLYLDEKLHPIISPKHWNVYSELHDMISALQTEKGNMTEQFLSCKNCIRVGNPYKDPCRSCRRNRMLPDMYRCESYE